MGMYNTYGSSQLKAGKLTLAQYSIGENVNLPDGVHCGEPNFIIVANGKFIAEVDTIYDYFGEQPKNTTRLEQYFNS